MINAAKARAAKTAIRLSFLGPASKQGRPAHQHYRNKKDCVKPFGIVPPFRKRREGQEGQNGKNHAKKEAEAGQTDPYPIDRRFGTRLTIERA